MRAILALALVASAAGCLRSTSFACATNADCTSSVAGTCEPVGVCSFPDSSCATGKRYGDYSGPYAGRCVGDEPAIDAKLDRPTDGSIDVAVGCPASYAALTGAGAHVYTKLATANTWATQRTLCEGDDAYLAIPDDAAELQAVLTLAGTELWVGISDQISEGSFATVLGASATFLPWESGQPDNGPMGNADCVAAKTTQLYLDDKCSNLRFAVCECVP